MFTFYFKAVVGGLLALGLMTEANALTLKTGEVLSTDANGNQVVMGAGETLSAQASLAENGYHISAGTLYVQVGDSVVEVALSAFHGASAAQAQGILYEAIAEHLGLTAEELGEMVDAGEHAAELQETLGSSASVVVAAGRSIDDVIADIDADALEGAIVGVSEEAHQAIQEHFKSIDGVYPTEGSCQDAGHC